MELEEFINKFSDDLNKKIVKINLELIDHDNKDKLLNAGRLSAIEEVMESLRVAYNYTKGFTEGQI